MNLDLLNKAVLCICFVLVILIPNYASGQNTKLGLQLGLNSASTVKYVNINTSNIFICGFNIIQKLENNWLVNANVNFVFGNLGYYGNYSYNSVIDIDYIFAPNSSYYPYRNHNNIRLNFPLKVGYEFDLYNYKLIPKAGIYATNPINNLDLDYGYVFELEINKPFKKIEFFSIINYQQAAQKKPYYVGSGETYTNFYAFNIMFGINLLMGKSLVYS